MWHRCNNCPSILPWICQKKGIDAIMLGNSEFCRKVDALLHAWELLVSYLKATGEVTKELIDWIEIRTLGVVLRGEWSKTGSAARRHLHELSTRTLALLPPPDAPGAEETQSRAEDASCGNEVAPETNPCIERFRGSEAVVVTKERVRAVLAALCDVITDPWPPLLLDILNGQRQTPDDAVLAFYNSELGVILKTRIDQLIGSKCEDMALRLVEVFIQTLDDESWNLGEKKWSVAHHYLDVYIALLHKFHHIDRITSLLKTLSAEDGLSFIRRHLNKDSSSRPWKQSIQVATIGAQMCMTLALVKPESINYPNFMEHLVSLWMTIYEKLKKTLTSFSDDIRRILRHAKASENIYELSKALMKQVGTAMRPFCIELNLRAFTLDLNVLLAARQRHDTTTPHDHEANSPHCNNKDIQALEMAAATHLEELAQLLHPAPMARRECLLSAFCLHPTSCRLASLLVEAYDVDVTGEGMRGSEQRGVLESGGAGESRGGLSNETTETKQTESSSIQLEESQEPVNLSTSHSCGEKTESHDEEMKMIENCNGENVGTERQENYTPSLTRTEMTEDREERRTSWRPDEEIQKRVFLSTLNGLSDLTVSSHSSPIADQLGETEEEIVQSAVVPGDVLRQPPGLRDAAELLGLEPSLCDDLVILISCVRVRSLSWALPWEELQARCIAYLREGYYDRIACRPLRHLRPDFSTYTVPAGAKTEKEAVKRKKKVSTQEEIVPRDSDFSEERHVNVFEDVLTTEEEKRTRSLRAKRTTTYYEENFDDFFSEKDMVEENQEKGLTSSQQNGSKMVEETFTEECSVESTTYPQDTQQAQRDDVAQVHDVREIHDVPRDDLLVLSSLPIPRETEAQVEQKPSKRGRKKSDAEGKSSGGRRISVHNMNLSNVSPDSQLTISEDESQWYEMCGLQSPYIHHIPSEPVRGNSPLNVLNLPSTSAISTTNSKLLEMSSKSYTATSQAIQSPPILQPLPYTPEHLQSIGDIPGAIESSQCQNKTVATIKNMGEISGKETTLLAPPMECSTHNPAHKMKGTQIKIVSATGEANYVTLYLHENNLLNPQPSGSLDGGATNPLVSYPGFGFDTLGNNSIASREPVPSMPSFAGFEETQNTKRRMISPDLYYKLNPPSTCGKETTILESLLLRKDALLTDDTSSRALGPIAGTMIQSHENQEESSRNEVSPSNHYHAPPSTAIANTNNWYSGNNMSQVTNGSTGPLSDTFKYAVLTNEINPNNIQIPIPNTDVYMNPRDPRLFSKYKIPLKKNQGSTVILPKNSALSAKNNQLRVEEPKRCETITKYSVESIGGHSYCKSPTNFEETKTLEGKINILGNESMDQRCVSPEFKMWKYTKELGHGSRDKTVSSRDCETSTSASRHYFQEFDSTSPLDFSTRSSAQLSLAENHPLRKCKKDLKLVDKDSMSGAVMPRLQTQAAKDTPHALLNQNYQAGFPWSTEVEVSMAKGPLLKSKNQSKKSKKNLSDARQAFHGENTELSLVPQHTSACGMLNPEGQNMVVKAKGKRGRKPKNATDPKVNDRASLERRVRVCDPRSIVEKQHPRLPNLHLKYPLWNNSINVSEFPNLIERCLALDKPLKLNGRSEELMESSGLLESPQKVFEKLQKVAIDIANPLEAALLTHCERARTPFLRSEKSNGMMICETPQSSRESSGTSMLVPVAKKSMCRGRPRGAGAMRLRETVYTTEVEVEKCEEIVSVREQKTDRASEKRGRKRRKRDDDSEEWTPGAESSSRVKARAKRSQTKAGPSSSKAIAARQAEEGARVAKERKKKRRRKRLNSDSLMLQEALKQVETSSQETEKSPRKVANGKELGSMLSPHYKRPPIAECATRKLRPSTRSKIDSTQL